MRYEPDRPSAALNRNQLLEMYYFARLARDIEERLVILFRQSKVIGGLYRSLGQEGESVATAYALERQDALLPLIRNMGALMTMGVRPIEIFRQYMAKGTSNSRGRDLNIHIVHLPAPDADDMLAVYDVAKRMVDSARAGGGPQLIGVDTMRMQGHAQHDDARYVPKALLDEWSAKDPIRRFRQVLNDRGAASDRELDDIDKMAKDYAAREADLAADE